MNKYWKIPPDGDAAFVAAMEDVLDVYRLPYDPRFPVVCMDESSTQLIGEVHAPIPTTPGRVAARATPPRSYKVRLVMDNLNTHAIASLYETFPPVEARRLANRLEIHYTPKHGRWLNIAEIELSALNSPCLRGRIPDIESMRRQTSAWQNHRNKRGAIPSTGASQPKRPVSNCSGFIRNFSCYSTLVRLNLDVVDGVGASC